MNIEAWSNPAFTFDLYLHACIKVTYVCGDGLEHVHKYVQRCWGVCTLLLSLLSIYTLCNDWWA